MHVYIYTYVYSIILFAKWHIMQHSTIHAYMCICMTYYTTLHVVVLGPSRSQTFDAIARKPQGRYARVRLATLKEHKDGLLLNRTLSRDNSVHTYIYTCICTTVYYVYVYIYMYIYVCMFFVYICMYVYVHIDMKDPYSA